MSDTETRRDPSARTVATALLALELFARKRLRTGIALVTAHHARLVDGPADVLRAAHAMGRDMEHVVGVGVRVARARAVSVGHKTAESEIDAVRRALAEHGKASVYRGPIPAPAPVVQREAAEQVGARFGEDFIAKVAARIDEGAEALRSASAAMRARVDTIAATETSTTFSRARRAIGDAFEAATGDAVPRRWVALLDERICPTCASLDGKVSMTGDFGGYEPGAVHPRCRCFAVFVTRAEAHRYRGAA